MSGDPGAAIAGPRQSSSANVTGVAAERGEVDGHVLGQDRKGPRSKLLPNPFEESLAERMIGPAERHGTAQDNAIRIDGVDQRDDPDPQVAGGLHDQFECQVVARFGLLGQQSWGQIGTPFELLTDRTRPAAGQAPLRSDG